MNAPDLKLTKEQIIAIVHARTNTEALVSFGECTHPLMMQVIDMVAKLYERLFINACGQPEPIGYEQDPDGNGGSFHTLDEPMDVAERAHELAVAYTFVFLQRKGYYSGALPTRRELNAWSHPRPQS